MIDSPQIVVPDVTAEDIRWVSSLLGLPRTAFLGHEGTDPRQEVLKSMAPMDIAACPGSGKTTLLVAKLAILAEKWCHRTRGICVVSHTNAARNEIETRLGNTSVGRRLLSYPHFIGTIHGFVNDFLAVPWLRSLGYPVSMIDTDICQRKRWSKLERKWQFALEKKHVDESNIRIVDTEFNVTKRNGPFPFGDRTDTFKRVRECCRVAAKEGYHCHSDMFIWAHDIIDRLPSVIQAIRDRFPLLFIDEAQDNSEEQSSILHRIFIEGESPVVRQRFGDGNQAIFDFMGAKAADTDTFPGDTIKKDIPNSHRFGQGIADLADPLGVSPYGIKGHGPKKAPTSGAAEGPHTVFLFDETSAGRVMDAYGKLLLATFSEEELMAGTFTAVGQVHRPPEAEDAEKFPHHVGHYWPSYDAELTSYEPKPKTFVQCLLAGRSKAEAAGEAYLALEPIAEGILRLAGMTEAKRVLVRRRHRHRQVLQLLEGNPEVRHEYEDLATAFAVHRESISQETWVTRWRDAVRRVAESVVGEELTEAQARAFLAWPEDSTVPKSAQAGVQTTRDNVYRYPMGSPKVAIRVGSIHSVKGHTHTATLVLDTFWQGRNGQHNLELLMPWLSGAKSGASGTGVQQQTRLKLHYVAMTRPTHLVCLAMPVNAFRNSARGLDEKAVQSMSARGWQVQLI